MGVQSDLKYIQILPLFIAECNQIGSMYIKCHFGVSNYSINYDNKHPSFQNKHLVDYKTSLRSIN